MCKTGSSAKLWYETNVSDHFDFKEKGKGSPYSITERWVPELISLQVT